MEKEQLQQQLEEVDYTINALTHTVEYINSCLLEILKQREEIVHQLNVLSKKRNSLGFKTSKDG